MSKPNDMPSSLQELLFQLNKAGITDYRRYEAVRKYLSFCARDKDIPLCGTFELTPLCNLDCKMCYVHLNKEQMCKQELLSTSVWKGYIDQAFAAGMMYAKITGGECLTYSGFREVYLHLRSLGIETEIYTNGVLLCGEMLEFLKKYPPAGIQITLYGANDDGYFNVTCHRVFDKVLHNIKEIQKSGLPLSIAITPNSFMRDGKEVVQLVHSLGLPIRINSGLISPREETGRGKQDACLDTYVDMLKLKNQLIGRLNLNECDEANLPDTGKDGIEQIKGVRCGAGRNTFSISWNGILRPCNTFPVISADISKMSFKDAWSKINSEVKDFPLPIECAQCCYKKVCKHCVAEHASGASIGHASPMICAWAKRMTAEGLIKL